jgi:mono/diheme cytochrome c family protein
MRTPWPSLLCCPFRRAAWFVLAGLGAAVAPRLLCLALLASPPAPAGTDEPRHRGAAVRERLRGAAVLFRRHCSSCHASDGAGSGGRDRVAEVPDFTDSRWQKRRSDAQLVATILDGKAGQMPAFRGKIDRDQAEELAALIRTFDPTYDPGSAPRGAAEPAEFEKRLRELQAQFEDLRKKFRELSDPPQKP